MKKIMIGAGLIGVAASLGGGAWFALSGGAEEQFARCSTSTVGSTQIGGAFTLVDETGATVTDTDVITKPTLVYFGYTFCPDVCPLDNWRNAEAVKLLEERGFDVQAVFISIDPARDTPEVVGEFTDMFHPDMIGLTGSAEQVDAASKAYKTYYKAHDPDSDEYYLVDHTTYTYLVLPEYGFVEFFRREAPADAVAESVACFLDES